MKLYRYIRSWESGERDIELLELEVIKETPKSWTVICPQYKTHIVRKDILRKAFAYPDKKSAFKNFKKRTKKALLICEGNLEDSKNFIKRIKEFEENNKQIHIQEPHQIY